MSCMTNIEGYISYISNLINMQVKYKVSLQYKEEKMADKKDKKSPLFYERKFVWEEINEKAKKDVFSISEDYKVFLDSSKTERESVKEIISEVLGLKKEEQDELANLLNKTSLSSTKTKNSYQQII